MGRPKYQKYSYLSAYPIPIGPAKHKPGCSVEAYRIDDPAKFEFVLVRGQMIISRTTNPKLVMNSWGAQIPDRVVAHLGQQIFLPKDSNKKQAKPARAKLSWQVGDLVVFRSNERLRMRVVRKVEAVNPKNPFRHEYWGLPLTKTGQLRTDIEPVKISPANWRSMRARGIYKLFKESRSEKISKYLEKSS